VNLPYLRNSQRIRDSASETMMLVVIGR
jgi:hypothetical protein